MVFVLLTIVHLWRLVVEPGVGGQAFFVVSTILSAAFCIWAARLLWPRSRSGRPGV